MPDILVNYASPVSQTTLTGLSTLPGGHVCVAGERILTYGDSDTNCGIWVVVDPGAWTRATDFDTGGAGEVVFNQQIVPDSSDGSNGIQAGSVFYVATTGTITPGTTAFTIAQRAYEEVQTPGVGLVKVRSDWQQSTTGIIPGSYDRATFDERGNALAGSSSNTATTFLEGLRLVWLSATSIRVEEGSAYVTGTGSIVDLSIDTDLAGLSLGTAGMKHVYLYSDSGVGAVEVSGTAPAGAAYRGGAREHSTDSTRRYIGSIRWTGTAVARFIHRLPDTIEYDLDTSASPYRVLSNGTQGAAFSSAISCSSVVPITSRRALMRFNNTAGAQLVTLAATDGTTDRYVAPLSGFWVDNDFLLDSSQAFRYRYNAGSPGSGLNVDVLGYRFEL